MNDSFLNSEHWLSSVSGRSTQSPRRRGTSNALIVAPQPQQPTVSPLVEADVGRLVLDAWKAIYDSNHLAELLDAYFECFANPLFQKVLAIL